MSTAPTVGTSVMFLDHQLRRHGQASHTTSNFNCSSNQTRKGYDALVSLCARLRHMMLLRSHSGALDRKAASIQAELLRLCHTPSPPHLPTPIEQNFHTCCSRYDTATKQPPRYVVKSSATPDRSLSNRDALVGSDALELGEIQQ